MRNTNLTTIVVMAILLCSVFVTTASCAQTIKRTITDTTNTIGSNEPLLKRAFLFGKVHNMSTQGNYTTVEALNLWVVFFKPPQFFHYNAGEPITFSSQQKGILRERFLIGGFTVILPINTNCIAVLNTTAGIMLIELYEDKMPITTANFITLANDWFYNGLVFHRVIDDFVIQGGGLYPNGTEKQDPYGPIILETDPNVHFLDGTIGMARTNDPNSATSQFFICDGAQSFLDGQYAAFGRVVDGMDVLRAISSVDTTTKYGYQDWPIDDIIINSITIVSS